MVFIENVSEQIGKAVSWLTLLMVILMTLVVTLRYGFNLGWIALQESIIYLHAATLMLGMSYVLKHDKHVRVDIFYNGFTPKKRAIINLAGHLLLLIPTCLFIIFISLDYVSQSWQFMEGSQEAGGVPFVYLLKTLIIIMPILLVIQAISDSIVSINQIKANDQTQNTTNGVS
ncbi:TRAP transporter small permease subunit [Psychrosphaera sp.]|nr:TRAP transporter small permease subunit [Psychrosphaera sp.]